MGGTGKEVERRRRVLDHARQAGNVAKTCRYFGIGRASFYRWRREYLKRGEPGLVPRKPGPKSHPNRTSDAVVGKGDCQESCVRGHSDGEERSLLWRSRRKFWTSCWLERRARTYLARTVCLMT